MAEEKKKQPPVQPPAPSVDYDDVFTYLEYTDYGGRFDQAHPNGPVYAYKELKKYVSGEDLLGYIEYVKNIWGEQYGRYDKYRFECFERDKNLLSGIKGLRAYSRFCQKIGEKTIVSDINLERFKSFIDAIK